MDEAYRTAVLRAIEAGDPLVGDPHIDAFTSSRFNAGTEVISYGREKYVCGISRQGSVSLLTPFIYNPSGDGSLVPRDVMFDNQAEVTERLIKAVAEWPVYVEVVTVADRSNPFIGSRGQVVRVDDTKENTVVLVNLSVLESGLQKFYLTQIVPSDEPWQDTWAALKR